MNPQPSGEELDRFRWLMTGALDGELGPDEQREFERLLAESPERQREWNEQKELKELTMKVKFTSPPEEVWDRYWVNIYNRLERKLAWILISIGAMIVFTFAGIQAIDSILADSQTPWYVKAGVFGLMGGGVILFVSVLREKLFTRKADKYKEIQR